MKKYICMFMIGAGIFSTNLNAKTELLFPDDEAYAVAVEKPAAPIGGMQAIVKMITIPPRAMELRVSGKVYLLIYVNEQGEVDDVKVVKGLGYGCDEAAVSAVKRSKFTPAQDKGIAVKSKFSMPIQFKL